MKRLVGLVVVVVVLVLAGVSYGALSGEIKLNQATGWKREGLQGAVKSIVVVESRPLITVKTEKEFDRRGVLRKEIVSPGEAEPHHIYYDELGNRTEQNLPEGVKNFRYEPGKVFVYMEGNLRGEGRMTLNGKPIEIVFFNEEKQMQTIEKYDLLGRVIERTTNYGTITHLEYNENGQWLKMSILLSNGDKMINEFTYDDKGNLQTQNIFLMGLEHYEYLKFDPYGNWIEGRILSEKGVPLATLKRKISYWE